MEEVLCSANQNDNPPHNPSHSSSTAVFAIAASTPVSETEMDSKRPETRHHGDESPKSETNDAESPVPCIADSTEEHLVQRFWRTVAPGIEVESGHFVDGIDPEDKIEEGGDLCEWKGCTC